MQSWSLFLTSFQVFCLSQHHYFLFFRCMNTNSFSMMLYAQCLSTCNTVISPHGRKYCGKINVVCICLCVAPVGKQKQLFRERNAACVVLALLCS
jgi:hypothetical protein